MELFDSSAALTIARDITPLVWGYLDPGSGSMLLQIVFAGVLSSLYFLKTGYQQLRSTLSAKSDKT